MNKKVWIGFIAVFVVSIVLDFIIHGVLFKSMYTWLMTERVGLFRPEEDNKMYIYFINGLFFSFFFTFIFSKGYEGKGLMEGLRYGFYVAMMVCVPYAYGEYAMHPIPYSVAFKWFAAGTIEYLILGAVLALIFGKQARVVPAAASPT